MSGKMVEPETEIGAEIRAERIRQGLTQRDLAQMVGMTEAAIRRIERGNRARIVNLNIVKTALAGNAKKLAEMLAENAEKRAENADIDPFGCRDEILRFFAAAEDLIRALKNRP